MPARLAVAVAVADVAAAALLLSAHAGLLVSGSARPGAGGVTAPGSDRLGASSAGTGGPALGYRSVPAANGVADYQVGSAAFGVRVEVTQPTWVQIQVGNASPVVAGVLPGGATQTVRATAPVTVVVGAGGASVVLTSGRATAVIRPASAPATLRLEPAGAGESAGGSPSRPASHRVGG